MREIGRIQQGYFPTQDRIVKAIATQLKAISGKGALTVLDAGCGEGDALVTLRDAWGAPNVKLLGIESDRHRADQAGKVLDQALWSPIETAAPNQSVSMLWFNPPYDKIRGAGRLEYELFDHVKEWPALGTGVLVMIVPDYILGQDDMRLSLAIDREYEMFGVWRYPEPEYQEFKQCVYIGVRRFKTEHNIWGRPRWAYSDKWPVLPDVAVRKVDVRPTGLVTLRMTELSAAVLSEVVELSPLRGSLLREATEPAHPIQRPLLPLRSGHLALALAGGLCDGIIEENGVRFLIKGTLTKQTRKAATKEKFNREGEKVAEIDVYRTHYDMNVRCLREDGSIEDYTSAEPEAADANVDGNKVEDE